MSDHNDLILRFSANWADYLESAMRSVHGNVLRRREAVATDIRRPAGLQNSVALLAPLDPPDVPSLMTALDTIFEFGTARGAGTVHMFTACPVPDLQQMAGFSQSRCR